MSSPQQFYYGDQIAGFVTKVYPIDPQDRRLYVDAIPADGRGFVSKAPVFQMPGMKRNLRYGAQVLIGWIMGNSQLPYVIGHSPNGDASSTYNEDLLAEAMENVGDLVFEHPETGAFMRFRAGNASSTEAAVDGGPATFEIMFRSGLTHSVEEYNPKGYPKAGSTASPPPPTRAKHVFKMPTGASIVWDELDDQHSVYTLTSTTGHEIIVDDLAKDITVKSAEGHQVTLSDADKQVSVTSAGGHHFALDDDLKRVVVETEAGLKHVLDDILGQISHVAGQVKTILDSEGAVLAHVVPAGGTIGMGDLPKNLDPTRSALAQADLATYELKRQAAQLQDLIANVTAIAPYLNNGAAAIAAVKALAVQKLGVSQLGSVSVRLKV